MSSVSLSLVVIHSADPARSREFYETLGLKFQRERHGSGPEHYACEVGTAVFEIYPDSDESTLSRTGRIGFRVPSVDAAVASLARFGARIVSAPRDSTWGRRAVVVHPDGHRIELSESEERR